MRLTPDLRLEEDEHDIRDAEQAEAEGLADRLADHAPALEYEYRTAETDLPARGGAMEKPDYGSPTRDLIEAQRSLQPAEPPYDEAWIERRVIGPWERIA
jgi:hypothetical protein